MKQDILKGVYEENLRMLGKQTNANILIKPPLFKKMFLVFSIALLSVLGHGNYLSLSQFSEKQTVSYLSSDRINPVLQKNNHQYVKGPVSPTEYKAFLNSHNLPLSRMFGLEVKTIMIDAGHGGSDTGTTGKIGTKEKDITLDIAKRLRERLERHARYNVIMTREEDITLPLNKRVDITRLSRADLFISVHVNYIPSRPINIIETYYFGPSSDETTLRLAEQENADSEYGLSDFKVIIEKIGETLKLQESKDFAASIQKSLFLNSRKENGNIYNFGVKRAPFVVLLGVDVPAVLAEVSCMSNREEEIQLNSESHRENIARYLEAGILAYLNKGEIKHEAKRQER